MAIEEIIARLDRHENRLTSLEDAHSATSASVTEIKQDTGEIVTLMRDAQGAWRLLELLSKAAKPLTWMAALAVSAGALWAQIKGVKS